MVRGYERLMGQSDALLPLGELALVGRPVLEKRRATEMGQATVEIWASDSLKGLQAGQRPKNILDRIWTAKMTTVFMNRFK
jgi:hypothetical protein